MLFISLFMFRLFDRKKFQVYCQTCGRDLTNTGGYVGDNSKIYCGVTEKDGSALLPCFAEALLKYSAVVAQYKNSKQIQKDIRERRLTHFGMLEKTASEVKG